MATYSTDTATSIRNRESGANSQLVSGNMLSGGVCLARATINNLAGITTGDIIEIALLPKGAVVLPHLSSIMSEGVGTTLTLALGDEQTPDKYAANLSLGGASGPKLVNSSTTYALAPSSNNATSWLKASVTTASGIISNKKLTFLIAYLIP